VLKHLSRCVQHVLRCTAVAGLTAPLGTALAAPNPGGNRARDVMGGYASTQIVVKLRPEAVATAAARQHFRTAPHDSDPRAALSNRVRNVAGQWRTRRMRPAFSEPFADPALAEKHGLDRTFIIEVPEGTDTEAMAAAFAALGGDIESATVDTIGGVADFFPNDTNFSSQYAMHNTGQTGGLVDADLDAPAAWDLHTGDFGTVTIAIIDSGVSSHVDLGDNVGPFPNGRFVEGRNTQNPLTPTLTTDGCPHGTHVAGIATAGGNNAMGVAGVTWGAYIMPVRVLMGCGGPVSALADGIKWAADHGADVGNMSLQYYNITQVEYDLLNNAVNYAHDLGMVLVAAAGNNQTRCVGGANHNTPCSSATACPGGTCVEVVAYPAKLLDCIGVSATTDDDVFASLAATGNVWFSNFGNEIDVSAPGDRIYSTIPGNGYALSSGTSMATPHVSGLAALMKSYVPDLTNEAIELLLFYSADDKGPAGWDKNFGFGRINAYNALLAVEDWLLCGNGVIDGDEECDPGPGIQGDCCNAICMNIPAGGVCRRAAGVCDVSELCTGSPPSCPADVKSTAQCRAAAGTCDIAETCNGVNDACPTDVKSTAQCRAAAGVCDIADFCNGVSNTCPSDAKSTAQCRASAGVCDLADFCNGVSNNCPADAKSTAECRPAADECDLPDFCNGVSNSCPADAKSTAECRPEADECDIAEFCDGLSNACPSDVEVLDCIDADGCCPPGCNSNTDDDCPVVSVLKWESVADHSPNQPVPIALDIPDDDMFSEPRSALNKVVITFDGPISPATATPQNVSICGNDASSSPVDLGGVSVSTATTAGDTVMEIIFTPGLPNFARYQIGINMNIQSADGGSIQAGVGGLSRILTALQGDYNGDRRVNATDLGGVRAHVGINPIDPGTLNEIRADANNDGRINATDLGLVRGRVSQDAQSILDPVCP